jgi:hypothetical protein
VIETADRPKAHAMDRIKAALNEWAGYYQDRPKAYPTRSAFVNERVQTSGLQSEDGLHIPPEVARLNKEIEALPPRFKQIVRVEYRERRFQRRLIPQKTKAASIGMDRVVYCHRLSFILEMLTHAMYGDEVVS